MSSLVVSRNSAGSGLKTSPPT